MHVDLYGNKWHTRWICLNLDVNIDTRKPCSEVIWDDDYLVTKNKFFLNNPCEKKILIFIAEIDFDE